MTISPPPPPSPAARPAAPEPWLQFAAALATPGGDENTQILGRFTDRVWSDGISNLQFGVSAAQVLYTGSNGNPNGGSQTLRFRDRPEIRVDGTRLIDTGAINAKTGDMIAFDVEGNWQNFYLGGEWSRFSADRQCGTITGVSPATRLRLVTAVIDHPYFTGWAIEGSWIITGETKVYTPTRRSTTKWPAYGIPGAVASLLAERRQLGRLGTGGPLYRHRPELAPAADRDHRPSWRASWAAASGSSPWASTGT